MLREQFALRRAEAAVIIIMLATIFGGVSYVYHRYTRPLPQVASKAVLFGDNEKYVEHVTKNVRFKGVTVAKEIIKPGDNFWKVARKHNVTIDTLIGSNPFWDDLLARVDQKVVVPNREGVITFVYNLDETRALAARYGVPEKKILIEDLPLLYRYYYRFSDKVRPVALFIPSARPVEADMTKTLAGEFQIREMFRSPLGGVYSSFYGMRVQPIMNSWGFHDGIDIAAPYGTLVGASRSGVVTSSGWMGGFGKAVIIEHDNGYRTLYGHLSVIMVNAGAKVPQGAIIGRVGSTGFSTGPHLHFTLWKYNVLIDPMKVLW